MRFLPCLLLLAATAFADETDTLIEQLFDKDKKVRAGQVPLILARGLGESFIYPNADLQDVQAFLQEELQKS